LGFSGSGSGFLGSDFKFRVFLPSHTDKCAPPIGGSERGGRRGRLGRERRKEGGARGAAGPAWAARGGRENGPAGGLGRKEFFHFSFLQKIQTNSIEFKFKEFEFKLNNKQ